jgi:uncharacterized protein YgbK (DUF1537 family)
MEESSIKAEALETVLGRYAKPDSPGAAALIAGEVQKNGRKIIVLDDDPTGVQTVHDVSVYTGWDSGTIEAGFDEPGPLFFVLTNSRGLTAGETASLHDEIGRTIARTVRKKDRDFIIISRSDSTLRGHYPLETRTLKEALEAEGAPPFDGEIICPFFIEGGRYTAGNIHYVKTGDTLVPAAQTEFAADKTFGYRHSDLAQWIEEKTGGAFPASGVSSVSIEDLRSGGTERAASVLRGVDGFGKVIVNALDYDDIRVFCAALYQVLRLGKRFMIRSAAAVPKVLGGVSDRPLLSREDLIDRGNPRGGLIVIGSHVQKTTKQLECLLRNPAIVPIEFNTHLAPDEEGFRREVRRVQQCCNESVEAGKTTVVFTSRKRFDLNTGNREDELKVSMKIAAAVTSFVSNLSGKPRFIVAKGGITSSEIGTAALGVKRALVLGQVLPGVPVWLTGSESRFPNTPYIIFPGNVGEEDSLKKIADLLE